MKTRDGEGQKGNEEDYHEIVETVSANYIKSAFFVFLEH